MIKFSFAGRAGFAFLSPGGGNAGKRCGLPVGNRVRFFGGNGPVLQRKAGLAFFRRAAVVWKAVRLVGGRWGSLIRWERGGCVENGAACRREIGLAVSPGKWRNFWERAEKLASGGIRFFLPPGGGFFGDSGSFFEGWDLFFVGWPRQFGRRRRMGMKVRLVFFRARPGVVSGEVTARPWVFGR